ncbi:MAG: nitroreductase family protein [Ilumatobacteraceae bacterium]
MELQEALRRRKMVRSFRRDPVPDELIDRVLASVLHAPSAGYTQGNEFLVLSSEATITDYVRITEHPDHPLDDSDRAVLPTLVVIPLSNRAAYIDRYSQPDKIAFGLDDAERWPVPYWDIDAGMASMLILLAAVELGLGALFAGIAHGEAELLAHFGVPDRFRPIGVIHLGYPTEADPRSASSSARSRQRRGLDEIVHRDRW